MFGSESGPCSTVACLPFAPFAMLGLFGLDLDLRSYQSLGRPLRDRALLAKKTTLTLKKLLKSFLGVSGVYNP